MSRDDDRVAIPGYTVADAGSGFTTDSGCGAAPAGNVRALSDRTYWRADLLSAARSASLDRRIDG